MRHRGIRIVRVHCYCTEPNTLCVEYSIESGYCAKVEYNVKTINGVHYYYCTRTTMLCHILTVLCAYVLCE